MRTSAKLRNLDDRVLGDRWKGKAMSNPDGLDERGPEPTTDPALEVGIVVLRVVQAVLLVLALVVLLGIVFTGAPTNPDNVIVRNVLARADDFAGPFKDVFTPEGGNKELYANYTLAIGIYVGLAFLVGFGIDKLTARRPKRV